MITGAIKNLDLPGIDVLGFPVGWLKGEENYNKISSLICVEK